MTCFSVSNVEYLIHVRVQAPWHDFLRLAKRNVAQGSNVMINKVVKMTVFPLIHCLVLTAVVLLCCELQ